MKTPDAIKKGLECCRPIWLGNRWKTCDAECPYATEGSFCRNVLNTDALAYILQLEAKIPQWISVKERLPENDDYYLTYTTEHTCEVYRYDGDGEWVTAWDDTANHDITHWMPLPEPPEEEV